SAIQITLRHGLGGRKSTIPLCVNSMTRHVSFTCQLTCYVIEHSPPLHIYIRARDEVVGEFHTSTTVSLLPYSLYTRGVAFGPITSRAVSLAEYIVTPLLSPTIG